MSQITVTNALAKIRAAGMRARYVPSEDIEQGDDSIELAPGVHVQICTFGGGYVASVEQGAGDDWCVIHGKHTNDPVAAAREALLLADG